MMTIVLVGLASFLAVFAIILKVRAAKPKKPEKWEKAQILERLLALSEGEDMMKGNAGQRSVPQSPCSRHAAVEGTYQSRGSTSLRLPKIARPCGVVATKQFF